MRNRCKYLPGYRTENMRVLSRWLELATARARAVVVTECQFEIGVEMGFSSVIHRVIVLGIGNQLRSEMIVPGPQ